MLSHTHLGVSDLERAMAFYGAVMDALGYVLKFHEPENGWAGWMRPGQSRPLFLIGRPYDGDPPTRGNGVMVALLAVDRATVDRSYAVALRHGGTDEGAPRLRPYYHPHYYGAYFRDPDGNKLGVCCHEPPAPRHGLSGSKVPGETVRKLPPRLGAGAVASYQGAMPLHLLKLAVGAASITDIEAHIAARLAARRAAGQPVEQVHTTRMVPKRVTEILDGGSLYWVIRGQVAARQPLLAIRPFTDGEGIGRCDLVLQPTVIPVMPRPCRPFQGWRYLAADTAPADLARLAGAAAMPEALRRDLAELCLI